MGEMNNMNEKLPVRELSIEEMDNINGGYIVKDSGGYHVIDDNAGYVVHTFQEEDYDLMMWLVRTKWKISEEFITWEEANAIRQKHIDEWNAAHP